MELSFCVLGSGSSGNSVLVQGGGASLLIDAGFSVAGTRERLAAVGHSLSRLDAIIITHEHSDHIQHAGALARAFDAPIYANAGTLEAWPERARKGAMPFERFETGRAFRIGALEVRTALKSHDAREPVAVRVDYGGNSLGLCTDLGQIDEALIDFLAPSDALIFEANHDPELLAKGPYPAFLRRRVAGREGHLSNEDAARALNRIAGPRLREVVLGHLSRANNAPAKVRAAFLRFGGESPGYLRRLSGQDRAMTPLKLGRGNSLPAPA